MASARILIVEDEGIVAKDIESSLTSLGYAVAGIVAQGEDAVVQAGVLKPDLILMDIMLKGAMDGIAAAERIRREYSLPVIYLTAYTDDDTLQRAGATESFGYLLKPFEDRDLRVTIEMALYKHAMERKQKEAQERESRLKERLWRSQRLESLGKLAGSVARSLNNILEPMQHYSDLIARNLPADSSLRPDLEIIKNSARKAVEIVHDLRTLGRLGHFSKEQVELKLILEQVKRANAYQALQQGSPLVVVRFEEAADLPPILGEKSLLQELVMNLLSYAFSAMPQGGHLTLVTAREEVPETFCGYEVISPGAYITLHVRHSGEAVPEEELSRIFEPKYAHDKDLSAKLSGLELAVVYAIVKEHNGFVDVRSSSGKVLDFIVYFPIAGASSPECKPSLPIELGGNETILVVDDDEQERHNTACWLRAGGYKVVTAVNGRSALDLLASAERDQGGGIDLVLLDMIMADDFDGLDTYKKILESNPRQKVIMASGFAKTDRIKEALKLGVAQYIQKPYDFEALSRAIRQELDKA